MTLEARGPEESDAELDELDAELTAARANLQRLCDRTIARFTAEAAEETNPYTREFLLAQLVKMRDMRQRNIEDMAKPLSRPGRMELDASPAAGQRGAAR